MCKLNITKRLPPLLHCSVRVNTRQSKEWFRDHLKYVIDEWFRGFVFDGATKFVNQYRKIISHFFFLFFLSRSLPWLEKFT
jgi:hypothetical protein